MSQTVVIITGKRIICVEEQSQQKNIVGIPLPTYDGQQQMNRNGSVYKHWNVFFKDIFRVSIDVLDRDNRISSKEFERALEDEGGAGNTIKNLLYFVLKIHFMMNDEPQGIKYTAG